MINSICFDVGGTLLNTYNSDFASCLVKSTSYSIDDLRPLIKKYFLTRKISMEEGLTDFCRDFGLPFEKVKKKLEKLRTPQTYRVFDDVVPTLRQLANYKLAILSDSATWETANMNNLGLADYFDLIVYSFDTGVAKPDIKAYKAVENKLGGNSDSFVMVGDSIVDIEGAKNASWHAVYLDRKFSNANKKKSTAADVVITTLLDLPVVIKSL